MGVAASQEFITRYDEVGNEPAAGVRAVSTTLEEFVRESALGGAASPVRDSH